ncbi:MAG: hypothetical protein OES09_17465 [Gammaproteobacteria bacterium]|nr:hypothetical protein [Gammaproteobacteria bacterium]
MSTALLSASLPGGRQMDDVRVLVVILIFLVPPALLGLRRT